MEGCAEHSFTMESIIEDAKRRRKDPRIFRNAFGSVPHELLWFMMRRLKVPAQFITICQVILNRTWAAKVDAEVRKKIMKAFRYPVRMISAIFHLPTSMGGLGVQSVEDNMESAMVLRALKCLNARDKLVTDTAWDQLRATITKRTGNRPATSHDVLNSPQRGCPRRRQVPLVNGPQSNQLSPA